MIPFKLFYLLLAVAENLAAREQLDATLAAALGNSLAENGKDSKVKRSRRKLTKKAYPEVNF